MQDFIVIGAGAIGRGYIPWILPNSESSSIVFVDHNAKLIQDMQHRDHFYTYQVQNNALVKKKVVIKAACLPKDFKLSRYPNATAVFICVGPRNVLDAAKLVDGTSLPVICCENDPRSAQLVKNNTSIKTCYFAIPDVITSNTAPADLLQKDSLSVVTEEGMFFLDKAVSELGIHAVLCDEKELSKQWKAKLYLHNTAHCVAAYLGALANCTYLHEVMQIECLEKIVRGSMNEMLHTLKHEKTVPAEFLDWYADKELKRFACHFLCDPILRVAREPLRKFALDGRLLGAAQLCLSQGLMPENLLTGIAAALLFDCAHDNDQHLQFMRKYLVDPVFFTCIFGLRAGEALEMILSQRLDTITQNLQALVKTFER